MTFFIKKIILFIKAEGFFFFFEEIIKAVVRHKEYASVISIIDYW